MNKLKELSLTLGLTSLVAPFIGEYVSHVAPCFKKSTIPPKKYAKRKKRLSISGRSRNINHRS